MLSTAPAQTHSVKLSQTLELDQAPAIFMYVSGEASERELANTLAHELHHVGNVSGCPEVQEVQDERAAAVVRWMGGFGEGIAVLAAAGGPEVHPHAASGSREWIVWERDIARFNHDLNGSRPSSARSSRASSPPRRSGCASSS